MSFVRDIEDRLRKSNGSETNSIEDEIPFWEFLDIEYERDLRIVPLSEQISRRKQKELQKYLVQLLTQAIRRLKIMYSKIVINTFFIFHDMDISIGTSLFPQVSGSLMEFSLRKRFLT
jgi:hypothetical protein